ncbi:MAG TPA: hypothetical protein VFU29_24455, partial [Chitinophagaceae bacterium]|nr:hypothetical protein [Chitinophagaceae bacterium]
MVKNKIALVGIMVITVLEALSQTPSIQWQKCLGGTSDDYGYSMRLTFDGGYIVVGTTLSSNGDVTGYHGNYDCWIVKLDVGGNILWQKALGGTSRDEAYSVYQTLDSGYIMVGLTESNDGDVSGFHGGSDSWVVKFDSSGIIQWQKCYGGTDFEVAESIQQTSDGGYIVGGSTQSNDGDVSGLHGGDDYWLLKLDSAGNIQWQKCLGGTGFERAFSVVQTSDGGYIMNGQSLSNDGDVSGNHGNWDYWIVKVNNSGSIQWQKSLGGGNDDFGDDIHQTLDGGYILEGESYSDDGDVTGSHGTLWGDCWVIKLDASGNIEWQKCLGGTNIDAADFIEQNADSSYVVAGWTSSNDGDVTGWHGGFDVWAVRISSGGNIQ